MTTICMKSSPYHTLTVRWLLVLLATASLGCTANRAILATDQQVFVLEGEAHHVLCSSYLKHAYQRQIINDTLLVHTTLYGYPPPFPDSAVGIGDTWYLISDGKQYPWHSPERFDQGEHPSLFSLWKIEVNTPEGTRTEYLPSSSGYWIPVEKYRKAGRWIYVYQYHWSGCYLCSETSGEIQFDPQIGILAIKPGWYWKWEEYERLDLEEYEARQGKPVTEPPIQNK